MHNEKWFDPADRPEGTILRVFEGGFLAEAEAILYLLRPQGFAVPRQELADADGKRIAVWGESALSFELMPGSKIIVLAVTGTEEPRCNFNECEKCGMVECAEHKGPGGAGDLAPFVHHTKWWTAEATG